MDSSFACAADLGEICARNGSGVTSCETESGERPNELVSAIFALALTFANFYVPTLRVWSRSGLPAPETVESASYRAGAEISDG